VAAALHEEYYPLVQQLIEQIASTLGVTPAIAGLVAGLLAGFFLGRITKRRAGAGLPPLLGTGHQSAHVTHAPSASASVSSTPGGFTAQNVHTTTSKLHIEGPLLGEIMALVRSGDKIKAIKRLREAKALDLAAAKAVIDSLGH
jgi:hypothetical protein